MPPTTMEEIGGTLVVETPEALTFKSTMGSNALGALGYGLLVGVPLIVVRLVLTAAHSTHAHNLFLFLGGPVAWLVAFLVVSLHPPLVVRRDGRIMEGGKTTGDARGRRVVARPKGNYAYLGLEPSPSDDARVGRRVMFPRVEEAERAAARINAFLDAASSPIPSNG